MRATSGLRCMGSGVGMVDMVVIKRRRNVTSLVIGVSPGTPGIRVTLQAERERSWRLRFTGLAERSACCIPSFFSH